MEDDKTLEDCKKGFQNCAACPNKDCGDNQADAPWWNSSDGGRNAHRRMAKATVDGTFCVWPKPLEAIEEITVFLKEGSGTMKLEIIMMSMKEFDELPEFDGW